MEYNVGTMRPIHWLVIWMPIGWALPVAVNAAPGEVTPGRAGKPAAEFQEQVWLLAGATYAVYGFQAYAGGFYGPAAEPMTEFWELVRRQTKEIESWHDLRSADQAWSRVGERQMLDELSGRLASAEALARYEPYAGRVRLVRTGLLGRLEKRVNEAQRKFPPGRRLACPVRETSPPAAEGQAFVRIAGLAAAPAATVRAWRDACDLYFVFECDEPRPDRIKAVATRHDHRAVLQDDTVEIALDPGRTGRRYYRLVINPRGVFLDETVDAATGKTLPDSNQTGETRHDRSWESGARVTAARRDGGWMVLVRVPVAALTNTLIVPGDAWGVNFARHRPLATDAWNDPRSTVWAPTFDSVNFPAPFGRLVMRPAAPAEQPVIACFHPQVCLGEAGATES